MSLELFKKSWSLCQQFRLTYYSPHQGMNANLQCLPDYSSEIVQFVGMSDALVGMVDTCLKVGVGLLTAGGSITGRRGVYGVQAKGIWCRVTPRSSRLMLGLWVCRGRGVSLSSWRF